MMKGMNRRRNHHRVRLAGALLICLFVQPALPVTAQAQENAIESGHRAPCRPDDCALFQIDDRILATLPYPSQYQAADKQDASTRPIVYVNRSLAYEASATAHQYPLADEDYWLIRLAQMDELRIKTLWESQSSRLFLGIDSTGFAGFIVGQKNNTSRGWPSPADHNARSPTTRAVGPDARPLVHEQSLTYQQPDLSETGSESAEEIH